MALTGAAERVRPLFSIVHSGGMGSRGVGMTGIVDVASPSLQLQFQDLLGEPSATN